MRIKRNYLPLLAGMVLFFVMFALAFIRANIFTLLTLYILLGPILVSILPCWLQRKNYPIGYSDRGLWALSLRWSFFYVLFDTAAATIFSIAIGLMMAAQFGVSSGFEGGDPIGFGEGLMLLLVEIDWPQMLLSIAPLILGWALSAIIPFLIRAVIFRLSLAVWLERFGQKSAR